MVRFVSALVLFAGVIAASSSASAQSAAVRQKQAELSAPATFSYWNDQVVQNCKRDPVPVAFDFGSFPETVLLSRRRLPEDACKQVIAAIGANCRTTPAFVASAQKVAKVVCRNGASETLAVSGGVLTYTFSDAKPGSAHYVMIRDWLLKNL